MNQATKQATKKHHHEYLIDQVYQIDESPKGNIAIIVFHCEDADCDIPYIYDWGKEIQLFGA